MPIVPNNPDPTPPVEEEPPVEVKKKRRSASIAKRAPKDQETR